MLFLNVFIFIAIVRILKVFRMIAFFNFQIVIVVHKLDLHLCPHALAIRAESRANIIT